MEEGNGTRLRSPNEMTKRLGTNPKRVGTRLWSPGRWSPILQSPEEGGP